MAHIIQQIALKCRNQFPQFLIKNKSFYSFAHARETVNQVEYKFGNIEGYSKKKQSYMDLEENIQQLAFYDIENTFGSKIASHLNKDLEYSLISEGKAQILRSNQLQNQENQTVSGSGSDKMSAFYNPATILEKDFSILLSQICIEEMKKEKGEEFQGVKVAHASNCDTGIRSYRFFKEIDENDIQELYSLDSSNHFQEYSTLMKQVNNIDSEKFISQQIDPNDFFFERRSYKKTDKLDIIDLENHGSSLEYIEYAIRAVSDNGLVMATFTDLINLCGVQNNKSIYYYGSQKNSKTASVHENAIRMIYYAISNIAAKHQKIIIPIFSFHSDFYIRVHFKVIKSKIGLSDFSTKIANVYSCSKCPNEFVKAHGQLIYHPMMNREQGSANVIEKEQIQCEMCDSEMEINGPIWCGELNQKEYIQKMKNKLQQYQQNSGFSQSKMFLQSYLKMISIVDGINIEMELSQYPLGVNPILISKFIHCSTLINKAAFIRGVESLGYKIINSSFYDSYYKTNAPQRVIFDVVKRWKYITQKNILQKIDDNTPAYTFLKKYQKYQPKFKKMLQINNNDSQDNNRPKQYTNPQKWFGPLKSTESQKKSRGKKVKTNDKDEYSYEQRDLINNNK